MTGSRAHPQESFQEAEISRDGARGLGARLAEVADRERAHAICWLPVLFGLGIGLYFSLASEPGLVLAFAPFAAVVAIAFARPRRAVIAAGLVAVTAGFAVAKLRAVMVAAPVLERPMGPVDVTGFVELVEPREKRGVRLTLRVVSIEGLASEKTPRRVRIRTLSPVSDLAPGQGVRISARLAAPGPPVIPGGYDFARAAYFHRIGAIGYTLRPVAREPGLGDPPLALHFGAWIERLRQAIGARVRAVLAGETGAIANALITGERGGISAETNEAYRNSGLFHVLSISGLHMVIMAGAVFYAMRFALAAFPAIALRHPIKKWAAAAAAVAALGYLLISGAEFATVRSYIMISIVLLAVIADRPAIAMRNVAIAALLILALYPESLLNAGFQMSFAAVVALVAAYEIVADRARRRDDTPSGLLMPPLRFMGGIILSTLVAGLAVAPLAAYHFHTSQQFAVVANLIAIPVCNFLVMPAALLTLLLMPFGLEAPALIAMGAGIDAMTWCANFAAGLPGAVGHIPAMPHSAFVAMICGGLWLCLVRSHLRLLGLAGFAAGAILSALHRPPDILAGRDGALVAVRGADGRLSAVRARASGFEIKRWLEHDGDERKPAEVQQAAAFSCDVAGCTARVGPELVAVARHPSALGDDCARAGILILDFPVPKGCRHPKIIADFFALRNDGTHAFYALPGGRWHVETVAQHRGERPWARRGTLGAERSRPVRDRPASRVLPSPPADALRPEVEDDDWEEAEPERSTGVSARDGD